MWYIWIYLGKSRPNSTHSVTLSLISSLSLGYSSNLSASPKTQNITPFVLDNTTPFSCIPVCLQSCIIYKPPPNQSHKNCIWSWKVFSQRCSKWVKRIKVCDSSERGWNTGPAIFQALTIFVTICSLILLQVAMFLFLGSDGHKCTSHRNLCLKHLIACTIVYFE